VFEPLRHPYAEGRSYTPPSAVVESLLELHAALGIERMVLVQPSVYGTDNACLLAALEVLGTERARGISVLDWTTVSHAQLQALHAAGVRGARLNLQVTGDGVGAAREQVRHAQGIARMPGWSLQVHARLDLVSELLPDLRALELPVVLDHFAGGLQSGPASEAALAALLDELRLGHLYVKLSAPYRLWPGAGADHAARLARAFHAAAPDRILWGSDWPHTGGSGARSGAAGGIEPFRTVDSGQVLRDLLAGLPDDEARHRLLVRNPAALYGFAS
jgi:predicted TIM-barrel fold metal-dependent hydrolase